MQRIHRLLLPLFLLLLLLLLPVFFRSGSAADGSSNGTTTCPFNFTVVTKFLPSSPSSNLDTRCKAALRIINLLQSDLLLRSSFFLAPLSSSGSCWSLLSPLLRFDPRADCGYSTTSISDGCMNISTRADFESNIPTTALADLSSNCSRSLVGSPCAVCSKYLSEFQAYYLNGRSPNNVSSCNAYPAIYTAAVVNPFGPSDSDTANCLFFLTLATNSTPSSPAANSTSSSPAAWIYAVAAGSAFLLLVSAVAACFFFRRKRRLKKMQKGGSSAPVTTAAVVSSTTETTIPPSEAVAVASRAGLVRYTLEEMKQATGDFARENVVGKGGYGKVYRGVLPDGAVVAVKRFKNFGATGSASFAHEVEVVASVRHVNLVTLRGYCIVSTAPEGHQRMLVSQLMSNGSVDDHLFCAGKSRLSWPVRRRIALGTARGLAYLHHGAQPKIIHRDVKASNVLLDDDFEPKLADFGLAKFAPEGLSHLSTKVAGTRGYVAPEYALYGKLSERSDVYSFGVLLLELLSGRRAVVHAPDAQPWLLTDWASSAVSENRAMDVVDGEMGEAVPAELVEKFVMVGVLCSHPDVQARPGMDEVLKMLETEIPVPPIPVRPASIIADFVDMDRSISSSGSGMLTTFSGTQSMSRFSGTQSMESASKPF